MTTAATTADLLEWLDSHEGQDWLDDHHHLIGNWGRWAWLKDDSEWSGGMHWRPGWAYSAYQLGNIALDNTSWKRWGHP